MALTRRDIARRLREANPDLASAESAEAVAAVVECVRRSLGSGDKVMISGFGTFEVRARADRRGIDPSSGRALVIRARRVVRFRTAPALLSALLEDD